LNQIFSHLDLPPTNISDATENVHSGFKLTVVAGMLTIDIADPYTRDLIRRRGLSEVRFPRIRRKDIIGLQEIYQDDIEFIEKRFNRRDLGWHNTPELEDFIGSPVRVKNPAETFPDASLMGF